MKRLNTFYFALLMSLMVFVSIEAGWAQEATFNFTNGQQSFVVPNGVFSIHIQAWGAQGASANEGTAGLGGFAEGDLAVTPGQTLEIFVGGQGCAIIEDFGCGGFNGGGNANNVEGGERGGGGGASDVRVEGTTLNDRVIVAAGGGGACTIPTPGGDGGGLIGSPGGSFEAGQGGTQNSGGAGFDICLSGQFGLGGSSPNLGTDECGGGGGGWYGGGAGCGAGGGSSYIDGVDNGSTTSGVRAGDGMVVLTWTPPNINLSPDTATNEVFSEHTVTATVLFDGAPEEGVLIDFEVISGPNTGEASDPDSGECTPNDDCTTDENGQVSWTYSSSLHGTDTIVATALEGVLQSNTAEKTWIVIRNIPTLSEWGLIAMAGILGIIGLLAIRRRKAAV